MPYIPPPADMTPGLAPRILLPTDIVAVVGDTLQLFYDGMIECPNAEAYAIHVFCAKGSNYTRFWEYIPASGDVGNTTFTVAVLDLTGATVATASTTLRTVNHTGAPGANKNILCLGDSLTATGTWPEELQRRLCGSGGTPAGLGYSNLTFIGNRQNGATSAQKWTGYSGWTVEGFTNTTPVVSAYWLTVSSLGTLDASDLGSIWTDGAAKTWLLDQLDTGTPKRVRVVSNIDTSPTLTGSGSLTYTSGGVHGAANSPLAYSASAVAKATPLWDYTGSALSFTAFCTAYGFSGIDALIIELGWNNLSAIGANASTAAAWATVSAHLQTLITQFHTDYPTGVVRLMGLEAPSPNGGLGVAYGAGSLTWSNRYEVLRSANGWNLALAALAATNSTYCRYMGAMTQFDSEYNFPNSLVAVNARNANFTELRDSNGIHPDTTGYYQLADVAYRDVIRTYCSA